MKNRLEMVVPLACLALKTCAEVGLPVALAFGHTFSVQPHAEIIPQFGAGPMGANAGLIYEYPDGSGGSYDIWLSRAPLPHVGWNHIETTANANGTTTSRVEDAGGVGFYQVPHGTAFGNWDMP